MIKVKFKVWREKDSKSKRKRVEIEDHCKIKNENLKEKEVIKKIKKKYPKWHIFGFITLEK